MSSAQWNAAVPSFSSPGESNLASITPGALAALLGSQNGGCRRENSGGWRSNVGSNEFSPPVDVFDTPTSYAVHVSLPGARREDIGVNYDEDKSEIQISGVVLRGGDEEFLKTLIISERNAGLFEKKVRLGDQTHPPVVDAHKITAKLENGVLEVIIPKREKGVNDYGNKKVQVS
ncbi:hypothetical protein Q9L58_000695 [Maublancomyces gigas]|uniref:SHSP domain-containing protein n=1 Tax=Discina gigas TaxID=1032678 RepID=A0ABR3GWQ4_9PEZI